MKQQHHRSSGKDSLDIIEEAVNALRAAPAATLAAYYGGSIPFVIGFLYFWTDMSRNPFAGARLADSALLIAALFIWMKFCQSVFARRIRMQVSSQPMPQWSFRRNMCVLRTQLVIQSSGLFLIPLSILLMAPFGWVYAFYQNVTALADSEAAGSRDTRGLIRRSWKQATIWPGQNHIIIVTLSIFGIFILLDVAIAAFLAPSLSKQFLGIETTFSRSPAAMLNSTYLAAVFGLTYLCIDPLVKTVYALRCFYGESLETGEDLKAGIPQFRISTKAVAGILLVAIVLCCSPVVFAGQPGPSGQATLDQRLNSRIDNVIQERKYVWREPKRDTGDEADKGVVMRFIEKAVDFLTRWTTKIWDWIVDVLRKLFPSNPLSRGDRGFQWITSSLLLYVLIAVVLSTLAIFLIRSSRRRKNAIVALTLEATPAPPDVADENVSADQLPEDGWAALARELIASGQLRLAMRAFYLASLAHLARRHLIGIARFKSNRDYENELTRRAHAIPDLLPAFGENVAIFERVWYGTHGVSPELVQEFSTNFDRIRSGA